MNSKKNIAFPYENHVKKSCKFTIFFTSSHKRTKKGKNNISNTRGSAFHASPPRGRNLKKSKE